ncbi:hypothetical protein PE066_03930 [Ramlibacter tataouinensis]|uniref:hypothetical protein n=1 Tax=Ramlibacter tataouinensis TaxID=94132 RepID=UPI0022F39E16|nr:hypothetical protein [Ramlibacter tataouinensis]WBY02699.1 hypothetical protein PE066_03930 [Ramlibacter tataouinensis]
MKPTLHLPAPAGAALNRWSSLVRSLTQEHRAVRPDHAASCAAEGDPDPDPLRTVGTLRAADEVRILNDAGAFQVVNVEKLTGQFAGLCKVYLRSVDHGGTVTLIRSPADFIRVLSKTVIVAAVCSS